MSKKAKIPTLLIGIILLAACQDDQTPTSPEPTGSSLQSAVNDTLSTKDDPTRPAEHRSTRFARQIPGFGGFFVDREGRVNVYMVNPHQEAALNAIRNVLLPELRALPRSGHTTQPLAAEPVIRQAHYGFFQLRHWRDRMSLPVLHTDGVTFVDLDEAENRLVVGVEAEWAAPVREAVKSLLVRLGVPSEAVVIRPSERIVFAGRNDSITSQVRPVRGGTQIHLLTTDWAEACTLGFNVVYRDAPKWITASHCTPRIGELDDTKAFQNSSLFENHFIGLEFADPLLVNNDFATVTLDGETYKCDGSPRSWTDPTRYRCRRSDAVLFNGDRLIFPDRTGTSFDFGYLARPRIWTYGRYAKGPLDIDQTNPRLRIAGEKANPDYSGQHFDKIGITTGWTYGPSGPVCADIKANYERRRNFNETEIAFRCQHFVEAGTEPGDSGGPVFFWIYNEATAAEEVHIAGVVSSREAGGFWYSSMDMIRLDLGLSVSDRSILRTF
jgi:hypothetical protein